MDIVDHGVDFAKQSGPDIFGEHFGPESISQNRNECRRQHKPGVSQ